MLRARIIPVVLTALVFMGCQRLEQPDAVLRTQQLFFNISVTRNGEAIPSARIAPRVIPSTKGDLIDAKDLLATMDIRRPFSLIGVEEDSGSLLLNNVPVSTNDNGKYALNLDGDLLEIPSQILFSAYYPT